MKRIQHPLYRRWTQMRQTVYNERSPDYPGIGGKGIGIDPKFDDFEEYARLVELHLGPCPGGPEWKLARKDHSKNFTIKNMEWSDATGVGRARPGTRKFKWGRKYLTLRELSEISGVSDMTIHTRMVQLGWSLRAAVMTPIWTVRNGKPIK